MNKGKQYYTNTDWGYDYITPILRVTRDWEGKFEREV